MSSFIVLYVCVCIYICIVETVFCNISHGKLRILRWKCWSVLLRFSRIDVVLRALKKTSENFEVTRSLNDNYSLNSFCNLFTLILCDSVLIARSITIPKFKTKTKKNYAQFCTKNAIHVILFLIRDVVLLFSNIMSYSLNIFHLKILHFKTFILIIVFSKIHIFLKTPCTRYIIHTRYTCIIIIIF